MPATFWPSSVTAVACELALAPPKELKGVRFDRFKSACANFVGFRCIDGLPYTKTLVQLAERAQEDPMDVKRIVDRLMKAGVLKLREKKVRTARLIVQLAKQELAVGTVGIDPSIMSAWETALGRSVDLVACKRDDGQVYSFRALGVSQAGANIVMSRVTMTKAGIAVNTALLVKPPSKQ